ncbi:MAG: hypothetical protein KJN76_12080 [Eudoraea sp.]|nr:hypothetical protein [Eudoraea sp.]
MKNTIVRILVMVFIGLTACKKEETRNTEAVRIRVANSGMITLDTVIIDNLTFVNIRPEQLSGYQIFSSDIGLPPSYFSVKTDIGERAVIYDYLAGASIANGDYTYEISMRNNGDIGIIFPPD